MNDPTQGQVSALTNETAHDALYWVLFGLVPIIGIPFAATAIVHGIRGLNFAGRYPEAKGKILSWAGIVLGGLVIIGTAMICVSIVLTIRQHPR